MKQLELDFNSDDLLDHYESYKVIDEGKIKFVVGYIH